MAIFRRIKDRVTDSGEAFDQPEWKAGYEFEGIYHKNREGVDDFIEQLKPYKLHMASSCEEVKDGNDANS